MFYFHNGLHRKFFLHVISNHTQQKAGNGVEFPLILYSHHNQSWYATYFTYCPVHKYIRVSMVVADHEDLLTQSRYIYIYSRCLMVSTDQADSRCFYFRIS